MLSVKTNTSSFSNARRTQAEMVLPVRLELGPGEKPAVLDLRTERIGPASIGLLPSILLRHEQTVGPLEQLQQLMVGVYFPVAGGEQSVSEIATYIGLFTAVVALLFGGQLVVRTLLFGNSVASYPSLMAVILFMGGVQLMTLGVIGEYLGQVFNEVKQRPLYLVERHLPSAQATRTQDG